MDKRFSQMDLIVLIECVQEVYCFDDY